MVLRSFGLIDRAGRPGVADAHDDGVEKCRKLRPMPRREAEAKTEKLLEKSR